MRTAILGGSFDPVHQGHLHMMHCAAQSRFCDRIIMVPSCGTNCSGKGHSASDADRLEMARLAAQDFKDMYPDDMIEIDVSPIEIEARGFSCTCDTVMEIKNAMGAEGKIGVIVGDDHAQDIPKWRKAEQLRTNAVFFVCRRTAGETRRLPEGYDVVYSRDDSTVDISSSMVRQGDVLAESLTQRVAAYVREHGLYN